MPKKDEIIKQEINDDKLDEVAGGACWFGAKAVAPDGHDIGCSYSFAWYVSWDEYYYKAGVCKYCGGQLGGEAKNGGAKYKPCPNCGKSNRYEW